MRAVAALDRVVEGAEFLEVLVGEVAEGYDVDAGVVLAHLFGELGEGLGGVGERGAGEDDYSLALRLVLAVLEGELVRGQQCPHIWVAECDGDLPMRS